MINNFIMEKSFHMCHDTSFIINGEIWGSLKTSELKQAHLFYRYLLNIIYKVSTVSEVQ